MELKSKAQAMAPMPMPSHSVSWAGPIAPLQKEAPARAKGSIQPLPSRALLMTRKARTLELRFYPAMKKAKGQLKSKAQAMAPMPMPSHPASWPGPGAPLQKEAPGRAKGSIRPLPCRPLLMTPKAKYGNPSRLSQGQRIPPG